MSLIRPILEASAEIRKKIVEDTTIPFRDFLTFKSLFT